MEERLKMEVYKDIKGYEGRYQITSWGRVWNVNRECFVSPEVHDKGYLRVDLYDDCGKRTHKKIHRLVAEAFIPNRGNKPQVNHIDGNKANNSVTNLEWVVNEENREHAEALRELARVHARRESYGRSDY